MGGGGLEPHIPVTISRNGVGGYGDKPHPHGKGLQRNRQPGNDSGDIEIIGTTNPERHSTADVHGIKGIMTTICGRDYKQPKQIGIPIEVKNVRYNL